ncbi:hypothetical protein HSM_1134 [Histophilus somni 2336]|uniref:hypothetical protein n=2 Tax=Histophilus somni TaxID=731 RepID=UPI0000397732|nr:hypothetical protein [Histophilus somni]ACA30856.1 hypothetical protein HSM_1134 [Histophilus somni 2336]
MIKQKFHQKCTAMNKKRINLFKMEKRLANIERKFEIQKKMNRVNIELHQSYQITNEEILQRLSELERVTLPEEKKQPPKLGCVRRFLTSFWDFLAR